jgi:hypothetical protein
MDTPTSGALETPNPAFTVPEILALLKVAKRTGSGNQLVMLLQLGVAT